jgi:hypothetical protein
MVAKSYQSLETVGEVFSSSGRHYINVKLKSGKIKTVRWYSDSEYRKMYPDEPVAAATSRSVKEALGFANGYITIFKGDTYAEIDWFHTSIARYAKWWGWYIVSTDEVPADIPAGITPVRLSWDAVGNDNGELKPESVVKEAVEALMYDPTPSEYIGQIGERLELTVTIEKAIPLDGEHPSTMYIMRADCGNCFVWTTAAKSWTAGGTHHLRGTVKDHRTYKGEKQTILNRCMEVK